MAAEPAPGIAQLTSELDSWMILVTLSLTSTVTKKNWKPTKYFQMRTSKLYFPCSDPSPSLHAILLVAVCMHLLEHRLAINRAREEVVCLRETATWASLTRG